jgi:hypothetical protein
MTPYQEYVQRRGADRKKHSQKGKRSLLARESLSGRGDRMANASTLVPAVGGGSIACVKVNGIGNSKRPYISFTCEDQVPVNLTI